jgi:hypothetical protein
MFFSDTHCPKLFPQQKMMPDPLYFQGFYAIISIKEAGIVFYHESIIPGQKQYG